MDIETSYLGDGVYASWDGYHIWLEVRGPTKNSRIALEPAVMNALMVYTKRVVEAAKEEASG